MRKNRGRILNVAGYLLACLFPITVAVNAAGQITISEAWQYDTSSGCYAVAATTDMNESGTPDIVAGDLAGLVYWLEGTDGSLIRYHQYTTDGIAQVGVLGDLNSDGKDEIIALADNHDGDSKEVLCINGASTNTIWTYDSHTAGCTSLAIMDDLNGDGDKDVAVGTESEVFALSGADGSEIWAAYYLPGDEVTSLAQIGDVNGDGKSDLLIGSKTSASPTVHCLSGADGGVVWTYTTGTSRVNGVAAINDVNGDGKPDALTGSDDNYVYCLDGDGDGFGSPVLIWRYLGNADIRSVAALGDINSDGTPEALAGSEANKVYCLDGNGDGITTSGMLLWSADTPLAGDWVRVMLDVGDLNGDGKSEVFAAGSQSSGSGGILLCNGADGSQIDWFNSQPGVMRAGDLLPDVTQDGIPEIISGTGRGEDACHLYTISVPPTRAQRWELYR